MGYTAGSGRIVGLDIVVGLDYIADWGRKAAEYTVAVGTAEGIVAEDIVVERPPAQGRLQQQGLQRAQQLAECC